MSKTKTRDIGLDITRIVAFISVVSVHFFLNSSFYDTPVLGKRMYAMTIMRTAFMVCVPLFMILSGYLLCGRSVRLGEKGELKKHICKCGDVIATYVIATVFILIFRRVYRGEAITIGEGILNLLRYAQYSWYVNMYLGLYLLIPFLNVIWMNLGGKSGQRNLVLVLLVTTVFPSALNVYDLDTITTPWSYTATNQIVPNFWTALYPITFYYIGAYIRTNVSMKELNTWKIFLLFVVAVTVSGIYNIWRSWGTNFVWGGWCDWGGWQNTISSVLLFLMINSIHCSQPGKMSSKVIGLLSELTFGAYLLSWIPDQMNYPKLLERVPDAGMQIKYAPIMVLASVVIALLGSLLVFIIKKVVAYVVGKLRSGVKHNMVHSA